MGVNEKTVRNIFREHVEVLDKARQITAPEWLGVDELHLRCPFPSMIVVFWAGGKKKPREP